VLEGGYELDALARSVVATLEALGGAAAPEDGLAVAPEAVQARRRLAERWPGLG
jgi:acetoin utilization deacetylase AcuC-like enzyme